MDSKLSTLSIILNKIIITHNKIIKSNISNDTYRLIPTGNKINIPYDKKKQYQQNVKGGDNTATNIDIDDSAFFNKRKSTREVVDNKSSKFYTIGGNSLPDEAETIFDYNEFAEE
jgi:hypothetical protein